MNISKNSTQSNTKTFYNVAIASVLALIVFSAALVIGHNPSKEPIGWNHVYSHPNSLALCKTTSEVTRTVGLDAKVIQVGESKTSWGLGCVATPTPLGSHLVWHFVTNPDPHQTEHSIRACGLAGKHMITLDFEVVHVKKSEPGFFQLMTTKYYVKGEYQQYDCWTNSQIGE